MECHCISYSCRFTSIMRIQDNNLTCETEVNTIIPISYQLAGQFGDNQKYRVIFNIYYILLFKRFSHIHADYLKYLHAQIYTAALALDSNEQQIKKH